MVCHPMTKAQYFCFHCFDSFEVDSNYQPDTLVCLKCSSTTRKVSNLSNFMLRDGRQYVIDRIKAPILKALVILANRLKIKPTKQNTRHPNTHVLIDIWDKFFEMEDNQTREPLFRALRTISVSEHETDPYYQDRMQVFLELWLEQVLKGNWKPRSVGNPPSCWQNDYRGIGYNFIKEKYNAEQA